MEIGKLRPDFKGIEARIIAYIWQDTWVNIASRFIISPALWKNPYLNMNSLAKLSDLYFFRDMLPITQLEKVLDVFRKGEFSIGSKLILYKRWMNQKWDAPYSPAFYCLKKADFESWIGSETFAYTLRGGESGIQQLAGNEGLRQIESKLATLRTPFVSLQDLATDFIGPLWISNVWGYPFAEISAPVRVRFVQPSDIQDGKATFHYQMEKGYKESHTAVGYVAFSGQKTFARRTTKPSLMEETSRTMTYQGNVRFPPAADSLTLILSYRGDEVDRQSLHRTIVSGENLRMAAYEQSDPGFEKFGAGLNPKDRKSRGFFEASIMLTFTFLGFSCIRPSTSDSVDIVAFTDDPQQLLLIECTTDAPGLRDKLSKLVSRRSAFGKRRQVSKPVAIIVTPLSRNEISADDQGRASKEGLILVAGEDLMKLVEMAKRGKMVGSTIRFLQTLPIGSF